LIDFQYDIKENGDSIVETYNKGIHPFTYSKFEIEVVFINNKFNI